MTRFTQDYLPLFAIVVFAMIQVGIIVAIVNFVRSLYR